jgi:hypothetical protein
MTTLKLVGVAVLCGAFTGLRGGLFSLAMWRLNVRIRQELFKSLLAQEVGFYDTAQTGVRGCGGGRAGALGCVGQIGAHCDDSIIRQEVGFCDTSQTGVLTERC